MVSFITEEHWTNYGGVRFLLKGAEMAPNKNPASKMTSFVTKEHWTNYRGRFREGFLIKGAKIAPIGRRQPLK
jgi:hypothetical protein